MALGEVGRCGVAIDSLSDMRDLFKDIDLGTITTSMTINSPAAVMLALFVAQAEESGVARSQLGGTLQNDILKEYQAQKEFVFPPRQSMRLVRDTIAFTAAEMPKWNSISVSGITFESRVDGRRRARLHTGQRIRLRRTRAPSRSLGR